MNNLSIQSKFINPVFQDPKQFVEFASNVNLETKAADGFFIEGLVKEDQQPCRVLHASLEVPGARVGCRVRCMLFIARF